MTGNTGRVVTPSPPPTPRPAPLFPPTHLIPSRHPPAHLLSAPAAHLPNARADADAHPAPRKRAGHRPPRRGPLRARPAEREATAKPDADARPRRRQPRRRRLDRVHAADNAGGGARQLGRGGQQPAVKKLANTHRPGRGGGRGGVAGEERGARKGGGDAGRWVVARATGAAAPRDDSSLRWSPEAEPFRRRPRRGVTLQLLMNLVGNRKDFGSSCARPLA